MIRILLDRAFDNEHHYIHAVGLSTDTKPTTGIITGSKFVAVDTGAGYLFDETAGEWNENPQFSEAVAAYLDEHPEALDQAAIEAMLSDQLDGIEEDVGVLKSAINSLNGVNVTVTPTWTTSQRILENGNIQASGPAFGYTNKIDIIEASKYMAYGTNGETAFGMPSIHFYNSNDEHIGFLYTKGDYDFTSAVEQYNPAYIRISHYSTGSVLFDGVSVKFETAGEISEIKGDIDDLEGDVSSLDGRVDLLESGVGTLEDDVETLENAVSAAVVSVKREPVNMLTGVGLTANKKHEANKQNAETANGFTLTDLIAVEASTLYALVTDESLSAAGYGDLGFPAYFAQFASDKSIILQQDSGYNISVETGANTAYIAVSFASTQVSKHPILAKAPFTGQLANPEQGITGIYKIVSESEIAFKGKNQQYKNLLEGHRNSFVAGKNIVNGKISANANFMALTDYIPCEPSTDYNGAITVQTTYNPTFNISWYTEDGTYISNDMHANNTVFTSPATAAFFRIAAVQKGTSYPNAEEDFSRTFFAETDVAYGPPCIDPGYVFTGLHPYSSMYGKTWVAFGDSITEKNVRSTINYHDYIRAETGITVINKGLGGAGYKCRWQNDNNMFALAEAYDFTGADVVTCMAGINDAWSDLSANMGDPDDVYDDEATAQNQSVMACFNKFLDVVIENAPFAKIGIISPIPCWTTQSSTDYHFAPDDDTSVLAQFVEKCKTACKNRGIPYLDLFHTSGLRPWDSTFNATMFKCNASDSPDGLHPNHLGHKYFYPLVREFIKQLI